jgi:intracellular sulfur oxidation DsrE/DsrF family protein
MKNLIIAVFALTILVVSFLTMISILDSTNINVVYYNKVIDLQQQQLIKGSSDNMNTEIRYLVITDKETFVCENSIINGKFNNSDIFYHLKKDSTYTFVVSGYGKSFFTDYRNIIGVNK